MNVGDTTSYGYTGGVQTFTVPADGLYRLQVYGACGGYTSGGAAGWHYGGYGGYSQGYKKLKKGTVLYICCGGAGTQNSDSATYPGYNGGAGGGPTSWGTYCSSGGGATHIGLINGTLAGIGYTSFVTNGNGLIVAGGGGGNYSAGDSYGYGIGGSGGGSSGGGSSNPKGNDGAGIYVSGGSQTSGYAFGQGGIISGGYQGGAGGGFYGGYSTGGTGGGGGSGWIGGVPSIVFKGTTYEPSMSNGANNGNGSAYITYVAKGFPTVLWNGVTLEGARHDIVDSTGAVISSTEIEEITFDGTPIE